MSLYSYDSGGQLWQIDVNPDGTFESTAVASAGTGTPGTVTCADIINNAMLEIGANDLGGTVSSDEQAYALGKLNQIFDNWNIDRFYSYRSQILDFTLTPAHQPHTIGTTADLVVTIVRPTAIERAEIAVNTTTYLPLAIRNANWWASLQLPAQTGRPYDLYYDPAWPNGNVYLWPVPDAAYPLRLKVWNPLAQFVDTTAVFSMPPGYENAVMLTLAEDLVTPFSAKPGPVFFQKAAEARTRIKRMNVQPVEIECDNSIAITNYRWRSIYGGY